MNQEMNDKGILNCIVGAYLLTLIILNILRGNDP